MIKTRVAYALVALAAGLWFFQPAKVAPSPPAPPMEIDLTAAFRGERAAEDASALAAMADEIANVIEWDGAQQEPALTTAKSLDLLRTRTREFMCRGESLGERNPKMRQIVGDYLETRLGTAGGAITSEQRAAWVSAYREIARASRHAVKK